MCSVSLKWQRYCPAEYPWKNTPIWAWLLVAVREVWVSSNKLMKDHGVRLICSTQGATYRQHSTGLISSETCPQKTCNSRHSPLFKLWISIAWGSRWMFNLTVSTERLVYQTVLETGKSLVGPLRSGGGLLEFIKILKAQSMWESQFGFY